MSKKRTAQEQIIHYKRKLRKLEESEKLKLLEALNTQTQSSENVANSQPSENTAEIEENNTPVQTVPNNSGQARSPCDANNDSTCQKSTSAGHAVQDRDLTSEPAGCLPAATPTPDVATLPDAAISSDESSSSPLPPPVEQAAATTDGVLEIPNKENSSHPDLDGELLEALGDPTDDLPKFGPNIHPNLAERWQPLLRKGLAKEVKEKLLKDYFIPENCPLLQAPKVNPEIAAASSDSVRNRDKKMEATQQQLGVGISAINKALTMLLTSQDKVAAIKHISDGCRILADLHYLETQARIKLVTPGLAKPFLNIIQDSERDETLFGKSLPDKIKASKAIEKQVLQIKKPASTAKNNNPTSGSTAFRANQHQGNWQGPPRYPSNRGGRGGQRKPTTVGSSRRQAPPPQSRPAGHSKSRAAAQQ